MATKKRMIDANALMKAIESFRWVGVPNTLQLMFDYLKIIIRDQPTVDAVPVDEIRVDIERLCLENQEAILNVSICGKPNEVKLPFSKEVVEVVHGRWIGEKGGYMWRENCTVCGNPVYNKIKSYNYCPNCGAKMDGERDTIGV